MAGEPRETAGTTICLIIGYVRSRAGDEGVARLLAVAGETNTLADLEDEHRWWSYERKIALLDAAAEVLDDPDVAVRVGEAALDRRVGRGLRVLLRGLGSPRMVLANVAKACPRFTTVATMATEEMGRDHAIIRYRLDDSKTPARADCALNIGLMGTIGRVFGQPLLEIDHPECQVDGADACRYVVHFPARTRRRVRRRQHERELTDQVADLTAQIELLQATTADLVSSDDLDDVLDRIVTNAGRAVNVAERLLTIDDGRVPLVLADGIAPESVDARAAEVRAAPIGATSGRVVIEVASSRRAYGRLAAFTHDDSFFPHEVTLLAAYARAAAAALDAATAIDTARRNAVAAEAMFGLARALAEPSPPGRIARLVAGAMTDILDVPATAVLLWESDHTALRVMGRAGWPVSSASAVDGLQFDVATITDVLGVDPLAACLRPLPEIPDGPVRGLLRGLDASALAVAPIRAHHGELYGLAVAAVGARGPSDALAGRLDAIADTCATALQNAQLLEQIRHQAVHDALTGLANRAWFDTELDKAAARAAREDRPLSVLFVDLDDFKAVNDRFGHAAGDHVLRTVADRLVEHARKGDSVARLGGDEFTVLLTNTGREDARAVTRRIREEIRRPIAVGDATLTISASIGLATLPDDGHDAAEAMRRADRAMYRMKQGERQALAVAS